MPKIRFLRENREVEVPAGANLRRAALDAGVQIYKGADRLLNCRGLALCGTCAVLLENGTLAQCSPIGMREKIRLGLSSRYIGNEDRMRLSCQTKVTGDTDVTTQPEFNWFGQGPSGYLPDKVAIKGPWHEDPAAWGRTPSPPQAKSPAAPAAEAPPDAGTQKS